MTRTSGASKRALKALFLDVDGVLTDGGFWWGAGGEELKRFCFADVMGISLATKAGLLIALISGEDSPLVHRFATKMGIANVRAGCKDKAAAVRDVAAQNALALHEICFMGDDVNDLAAMELVGLAAAPADARDIVLQRAEFISSNGGGNGAVRDLVDAILAGVLPAHRAGSETSPPK